jgi:hypothetical protein
MKSAFGPVSIDLQVTSLDELTLKDVIDKVRKLPGVEGEQVNDSNEINIDNFMKALSEEAQAAAGFFGDDVAAADAPTGRGRPPTAVVEELRKGGGVNWALFTVDARPASAGGAPTDASVLGVAGVPVPGGAAGGGSSAGSGSGSGSSASAGGAPPRPLAGGAAGAGAGGAVGSSARLPPANPQGKLPTGSWIKPGTKPGES